MVFPVARKEDDGHVAVFSHPRRIAGRAVRRDEELRLFVLKFERVPEGGPSDDSNNRRGHGKPTRSHRAIKLPSPTRRFVIWFPSPGSAGLDRRSRARGRLAQ